jgi:tetratricopeptide (TPR) repeat protein
MAIDPFGYPVTLHRPEAVSAWDDTLKAFLAHGAATPVHLGRVLELAPHFPLGHVGKGMFYLLLGRRELLEIAREALETAKACPEKTPRESAYIAALSACFAGDVLRGLDILETILTTHRADAFAMKLSHAWRFVLGDSAGMRQSLERVAGAYTPDHMAHGYFQGCLAFAYEETGDYAAAHAAGLRGLEVAPDDAWGLHAVAHVHDMTGNARAGLDWLSGRETAWAHCNNFRYHVWWHKALMHLDLGQTDAVLALYDTEIRADKTDDYRDIANATSLLSRLELEGVDVGTRWQELADLSEARTEDGCLIFADLHYILALSAQGRTGAMARMLGRMETDAALSDTEARRRMARPGLSAARGLEAFGEGDYATAFINLRAARPEMQKAGGSHAQRDVFERITIDAGLRAGHFMQAEALLADRTARRGAEDGFSAARRSLLVQARTEAAILAAQ